MIKLNIVYKAGKQEVKFQEKEPGLVYAEYGDETVEGKMEGNTLKGIFHNKKVNVTGLMELTFHETGFEGRWKKGIEPGELKQKWNAILVEDKNPTNETKNGYHVFTDEDNIRYEGEWENDEFISGKAEYVDEDGEKVIEEGIFEQGNLKEGKITWSDGNTASGTFDEELELNGKGIYTWENGDFQDGTWVHGEFKDGKAKVTHDDGEISEGMMKDGEWVEEEVLNSDELLLRKSFQVGDKVHLPITQMGEELDFEKIDSGSGNIKSALNDGQSFLYITFAISDGKICYEGDEIPRSEEQILYGLNNRLNKKGNPFWSKDLTLFDQNNLNNVNTTFYEKIKSSMSTNNLNQNDSVGTKETTKIDNHDRPEKSPLRSLATNIKKLFEKQDYEGVCIYADLSREYPNDIFDKILISAVNTLDNKVFNDCKSKFDNRGLIWDFEDENKPYKTKWLEFFDHNKQLLTEENKSKLENDLKGEKYEGETLNGSYHGKGIYTWPDGRKYEGDFLNGKRHGMGTYTWPDGNIYVGDWIEGERNGKGIYNLPNGEFREGKWENNEFISGRVKWIFDSGAIYEGEYSNGKWNGNGTYIWPDGRKYVGEWKNDLQFGKGIFTWANGQKYEGEFLNGNSHGYGKQTWPNGEWKEGKWENDEFISGKVFIIYDSGDTYDGYFSNNNRNGEGCYTWSDGTKYTGNFLNGESSGKGIYTNPDGKKYTGNFLNDNIHGYGKMTWSNGDYFEGNWENGKRLGKTSFELKEEQRKREEDERRYSEEIARREQEELRHNEEKAKREADELERKKAQEKKKVEEAEEKERKKKQEAEEKTKSRYFEITYKIKLKEDKHQTHVAGGILDFIVMGGMSKTEKTHGKGQLIQRTIRVSHEGQTLSDSSAKNYILQNDPDVRTGKAGSSTIMIIKIK